MKRGLEMGQEGYKRYGQHLRGPKYVLFEATFHVVSYERARRREDNDRFLPLQWSPLVRSAFCPTKIDHTSGLTLQAASSLTVYRDRRQDVVPEIERN